MRQVAFVFLIGVPLFVLLVVYAVTHGLLPRGWETEQRRLDTGDVRYCILGVPYEYEKQSDVASNVVAQLAAMDPPLPHVWYVIWTGPRGEAHISSGAGPHESSIRPLAGLAAQVDPVLGRTVLNYAAAPYLPPGSVQEWLSRDWGEEVMLYSDRDDRRGSYLTPGWFGDPEALAILAALAYKPIRMEDSAPDAAAYLWPNEKDTSASDLLGRTVLHRAAFWGREDLVRRMLAQGLDRDARDAYDWTPLHTAALWGQVRVVMALLDARAEVDCRAKRPQKLEEYRNALDDAGVTFGRYSLDGKLWVWRDDAGYTRNLVEWDTIGATPLHLAAYGGRLEVIGCLLDRGAHVDAADANGRTPLMWAAAAGRAGVVKELLARGANASLLDAQGMSARDWAKKLGRTAAEGLLK